MYLYYCDVESGIRTKPQVIFHYKTYKRRKGSIGNGFHVVLHIRNILPTFLESASVCSYVCRLVTPGSRLFAFPILFCKGKD